VLCGKKFNRKEHKGIHKEREDLSYYILIWYFEISLYKVTKKL